MVTVPTTEATPPYGPKLESLTHIDITKLSQSELCALSLCSDSIFDLRRTDDVVIPQIDRSFFNESAGSLRQTYSRHLHSSSAIAGHRCRLPGLLPNHRTLFSLFPDDPELVENKLIVSYLKQFISDRKAEATPPPQPAASGNDMQMVLYSGENKRKRGTKPKPVIPISNIRLEIVNKNGAVVDLKALENGDELYAEELRRRSVGLENEEVFLSFLGNLEGQWGSRRKKRRFVDACEFGDWLPIGWKLLLGLKRKEGRVSVYCRRFISPNGQQFTSCKESSSFLQSYFRLIDANQQLDGTGDNNQQCAGVIHKNGCIMQDSFPNSTVPNTSIPHVKEMELDLMGIENLPDVQVRDLFECYKCNLTFDEKHPYLKHLMSFHQRTTRRYRLGSSIGEAVIIKEDGKYECQICRKVFQERQSYNGHVGVHVRNHVRHSEELPGEATVLKSNESPSLDKLPPRISKMDALIGIAQSSILENSSAEPNDKASGGSSPRRLEVATVTEHHAVNSDHELASDHNELELEDCMTKSIADQACNQNYVQCITNDEEMVNSIDISHAENNAMAVCTLTFEHSTDSELEKHGNSEREIGLNSQLTPSHDVVTWSSVQNNKENVPQSVISDSSMTMMQPLDCFLSSTAISIKGHDELCTVYQKLNSVADFDELRLEEMERLQFSFMNRQESPPLPGVSMNVVDDAVVEDVFNSSFRCESEAFMLNIDGRRQFTTTCVWCRTEFNHEAFESETRSDSVGFMCRSCKAKISGQLNVLDGGLSMNYRL